MSTRENKHRVLCAFCIVLFKGCQALAEAFGEFLQQVLGRVINDADGVGRQQDLAEHQAHPGAHHHIKHAHKTCALRAHRQHQYG